eukprot:8271988-Pyramimonas_sp.AAC.1
MSQLYLCMGRPSRCLRISNAIRRCTPRAMSWTACSGTTATNLPNMPRAMPTASSHQVARGGSACAHEDFGQLREMCGPGWSREWVEGGGGAPGE